MVFFYSALLPVLLFVGSFRAEASDSIRAGDLEDAGWEEVLEPADVLRSFEAVEDAIDSLANRGSCESGRAALSDYSGAGACKAPSNACRMFIQDDCSYGEMGKKTVDFFASMMMNRSDARENKISGSTGHFISNPPMDISLLCPKYEKFPYRTKEKFWVWVVMQLAFEESGCGVLTVNAENKQTRGMFQLEASGSSRKNLRPVECWDSYIAKNFPRQSISDDVPNLRCAISQLSVQFARPGSPVAESRADLKVLSKGKVFSSNSYFQQLRRVKMVGVQLYDHIKLFPECR